MSLYNVIALSLLIGAASALFFAPCSEVGCTSNDEPVCGSDGMTYANPCILATVACLDRTVKAVHKGACDWKAKDCPSGCYDIYSPVCGNDGKTYGNKCELMIASCESAGNTTMADNRACNDPSRDTPTMTAPTATPATPKPMKCQTFCSKIWSPVCGSDGKTYSNMCFLNIAKCKSNGTVTMVSKQPCKDQSRRTTTTSSLSTTSKPASCLTFCSMLWSPVCGSDGRTYSNMCFLNIAKCKSNGKVTMVAKQPCERPRRTTPHPSSGTTKKNCPSICFTLYSPVCGSDGKTYSNTCRLGVANCKSGGKITMVSRGRC